MPDDDTSVYPLERVNIKFKSAAEGDEDVEIPFRLMVMGQWSTGENETPLEERRAVDIDQSNFAEIMAKKDVKLDFVVPDELSGVPDSQLQVKLDVDSLGTLTPDGLSRKIPELRRQVELRESLKEVKGDLANPKKMKLLRAKLAEVLKDEELKRKIEELKVLETKK